MTTLTKQQVKDVIEGKCAAPRIPLTYHLWVSSDVYGENAARAQAALDNCPCDVSHISLNMPQVCEAPADAPSYRFVQKDLDIGHGKTGIDAQSAIDDWDELDEILANFPSPEYPNLIPAFEKTDKYTVIHWWYLMFERFWSLRGMENALVDFYTNPDEVHKLFAKLTEFYCRVLERGREEAGADAVFVSDDIGTQTGPFFSLEIFREFLKPYYKIFIDKAHSLGMHVWLHTCGNIEAYLPELIEIGLDVIHPIQKYTMVEKQIAGKFGDKICIWAGFDVQQIIPYGTPDEVRAEVRNMIDTYRRPEGRLMLTFGNNVTADCPIESLEALLDESMK